VIDVPVTRFVALGGKPGGAVTAAFAAEDVLPLPAS
jgi:hypothetical protein